MTLKISRIFPLVCLILIAGSVSMISAFHLEAHNITSANVTIGTETGTFNNTWEKDGTDWRINEVAGTPAFVYHFNITVHDLNEIPQYLACYQEYIGNPAHVVEVSVLNQLTRTWEIIGVVPDLVDMTWMNYSIVTYHDDELFSGLVAEFRVIHTSNGVAIHDMDMDFISLYTIEEDDPMLNPWDINWLLCLIWLGLVAIGVFKENRILTMFAGFFGIILGLLLLGDSGMVSIALILLNLYLVYAGSQ